MQTRSHSRSLLAMVGRLAEQDPADVQGILDEFDAKDRAELSRLVELYQQGLAPSVSGQDTNPSPSGTPAPVYSAWLTSILSLDSTAPGRQTAETRRALQTIAREQGWRPTPSNPDRVSRLGRLLRKLGGRS